MAHPLPADDHDPVTPKRLLKEGTPAQIREAIVEEDREHFDREYRAALNAAAETLTLDPVDAFLADWRTRGAHQLHMGHDQWRAVGAEAERRLAGGAPPAGMIPPEEAKARLRARIASGV